jgi:hypothetical protein
LFHVVTGASVLATSLVLTLRASRALGRTASADRTQRVPSSPIPATPISHDKSRHAHEVERASGTARSAPPA